ncbi:hypothetical protein SAY86_028875 [Trapa natans]|uniref:Uncharacterized protein n=1 Tax=Trapa natans TaxID=22666 RepID=A0AAN7R911_TRANT|nr:hypothetical protein SAY86_028875 [Trapa natans]
MFLIYSYFISGIRSGLKTYRSNLLPDRALPPNLPVRSLGIQESNIPTSCFLNSNLSAPHLDFVSPSSNMSLNAQSIPGNEYTSYKSTSAQSPTLLSLPGQEIYSFMSSMNKRKFSPYNWEPSVPFGPSFSISSVLPSLGSQYDPFLDSIEQSNVGGVFRAAEPKISANRNVSGCENEHSISKLWTRTIMPKKKILLLNLLRTPLLIAKLKMLCLKRTVSPLEKFTD